MKTTADYIDDLRAKLGVDSDFKAMNALGVKHRQQVSEWRQLHSGWSEDLSVRVAEVLEIDPAEVLLAMEIQREKNEKVRSVWERIAANMNYATAASLAVLAVTLTYVYGDIMPAPLFGADGSLAWAFAGFTNSSTVYIMRTLPLVLLAFAALLFYAFPRHNPRPRKEPDTASR